LPQLPFLRGKAAQTRLASRDVGFGPLDGAGRFDELTIDLLPVSADCFDLSLQPANLIFTEPNIVAQGFELPLPLDALGFDTLLGEIGRGRGTLYEPLAVDACVKLFHEGRFAF